MIAEASTIVPFTGRGYLDRVRDPDFRSWGLGTGRNRSEISTIRSSSEGNEESGIPDVGRDTRARKRNDSRGLRDHVAELFHAAMKVRCDHAPIRALDCPKTEYPTGRAENSIASPNSDFDTRTRLIAPVWARRLTPLWRSVP